jgi:tetratricopeptide (TPR) repeat protein
MSRLFLVSQLFSSARVTRCGLTGLVLFAFLLSLQAQESASLRGNVRDSQGKPVADAVVHLRTKDRAQTQEARTDSQGRYGFTELQGGVYILRATATGYRDAEIPSLFFSPKEVKSVDLTMLPAKISGSQVGSASTPEFFDPPQFTVAGVTDTTSLGGHGSDTIVRTRETLAKETVSLGKNPASAPPAAVSANEELLRQNVEREPASFEANYRLGKVLLESGNVREAIPYLERAGKLEPDSYANAYELALANAQAGDYERARDRAKALLVHGDQAELHHLLGDVEEKLGNSLEAVREYQSAAELLPSEAYLFDWGSELLLHHAPDPAVEVFTKANRLFPRSVRILIGLGAAWFARGSYDQAVQRICEASDLNPNDSNPYVFLGKMQNAEPTPSKEVVERLHRFVAQQPGNSAANYYYAIGLWKLQQQSQDGAGAAQVEALLRNAIRLDPKFAAAHLQLGILHSEQRDYLQAISDYRQAIDADSQMEQAHYRLAQAYRQVGDAAAAEAELRIYDRISKETAQRTERERHEIRQFVYTLRDQAPAQKP